MTKQQAQLIIGLLAAAIAVQLITGLAVLRGIDLARNEIGRTMTVAAAAEREAQATRREAEAAQVSAEDTLEMQKRAAGQMSIKAGSITIMPRPGASFTITTETADTER